LIVVRKKKGGEKSVGNRSEGEGKKKKGREGPRKKNIDCFLYGGRGGKGPGRGGKLSQPISGPGGGKNDKRRPKGGSSEKRKAAGFFEKRSCANEGFFLDLISGELGGAEVVTVSGERGRKGEKKRCRVEKKSSSIRVKEKHRGEGGNLEKGKEGTVFFGERKKKSFKVCFRWERFVSRKERENGPGEKKKGKEGSRLGKVQFEQEEGRFC